MRENRNDPAIELSPWQMPREETVSLLPVRMADPEPDLS